MGKLRIRENIKFYLALSFSLLLPFSGFAASVQVPSMGINSIF